MANGQAKSIGLYNGVHSETNWKLKMVGRDNMEQMQKVPEAQN